MRSERILYYRTHSVSIVHNVVWVPLEELERLADADELRSTRSCIYIYSRARTHTRTRTYARTHANARTQEYRYDVRGRVDNVLERSEEAQESWQSTLKRERHKLKEREAK